MWVGTEVLSHGAGKAMQAGKGKTVGAKLKRWEVSNDKTS